ncbi:MAG: type II secretion system F family protein [Chlamydiia bacterium]|nr:type II secretion system F family protein [Chlamydiia bacterium]
MPLFYFRAVDADGKRTAGHLEVRNAEEAKQRLRARGFTPIELKEQSAKRSKGHLKDDRLVDFTLQLAQLLRAGVPLYESLHALEEQYHTEKFHQVIQGLCHSIKEGLSLSKAMESYPDSFDNLYRSMIAAGEAVGAQGVVLEKLADLLKKRLKLKGQLKAALIYPAVLASFSLIVIGIMVGFVVPSIENIFQGRQLNGFTEAVLGFSHFMRSYWWALLLAIAGGFFAATSFLRSPSGREWRQRTALKLPVIRHLSTCVVLARFCRTQATLQEGGLTLVDALDISKATMGNVVFARLIDEAKEKIIAGSSLGRELSRSPLIPHFVSRMLLVGEEAGTIVPMLGRVADMYEEEVEKALNTVVALAQPVILIFMGGVIGIIMLAILLPMTDIASIAS